MTQVSLTVISQTEKGLDPKVLADVEAFLADIKAEIKEQRPLSKDGRVVDYSVVLPTGYTPDTLSGLKVEFYAKTEDYNVDVALQIAEGRQERGLFVFDMDSTLIQQEVIEMIAAYADVEPEVERITTAAMNGEIDFTESLMQRVALLKGIRGDVFEQLKPKVKFTPGAHELTRALRRKGIKLAVLSGGFIPLAEYVKGELGLNYAYANQLEVDPETNTLTGKTTGTIVQSTVKAELLKEIAAKENVALKNVVAVGDGSNDLAMMATAGYGVAFNAKPVVQKQAPARINTGSLKDILYILGYTDEEQQELTKP